MASIEFWGLTPQQWDVVGTLGTTGGFVMAGVAALIAAGQLRQTRQSRLDQSRPYVIITAEPSPVSRHLIDIVIQNAGASPARDVSIKVTPPLRAARHDDAHSLETARIFTEPISMLPPGFKIRTFFDSAIERNGKDLPSRHQAEVSYHDGHGHEWSEVNVLDMELQRGMLYTDEYSIHHAAKALREIEKSLKESKALGGVIDVVVEAREDRIERVRRENEERARQHDEFVARMKPNVDSGDA